MVGDFFWENFGVKKYFRVVVFQNCLKYSSNLSSVHSAYRLELNDSFIVICELLK